MSNTSNTSNLSALHRETARAFAADPAVRHRRDGGLAELSWSEYRAAADRAAGGLIALGVGRGDKVALLAENRPEWLCADVAILAAGAVTVPLHASLAQEQVAQQLAHSGAVGVVVSDRVQADKVRARSRELGDLRFLVHFDALAADSPDPGLESVPWTRLGEAGVSASRVLEREQGTAADALASIIYTSGTSGEPKGVMLTHGNILSTLQAFADTQRLEPGRTVLNCLPLSHVFGRVADHFLAVKFGAVLGLCGSPATLLEDLAEMRPSWFFAVPRVFEKIWLKVAVLPDAQRGAALRAVLGGAVERVGCGGAPLSEAVAAGFEAAGLPLREGYGLTEATAVVSMQQGEGFRCGTVGQALAGTELRIAEDGEILVRGPHVMAGYWRDGTATAAAIQGGWLHTGDLGAVDGDGFLTISGRKKDLFVTSGGKTVAPAMIERILAEDPFIDCAVAIGDGRDYLTALIVPDFAVLATLAGELGALAPDPDGCVRGGAIARFYQQRVEERMQQVSSPERVKRILVLGRPLSLSDGEVTTTQKARRTMIIARFQAQIDALYA